MKKILLITGKLAYPLIRRKLDEINEKLRGKYHVDITVLPIDVIALATPEFLKHHLGKLDLSSYDYVVVPGSIGHDLGELSRFIKVRIVKSPTRVDLLETMFLLGLEKFSPSRPGEEIIRENINELYNTAYRELVKKNAIRYGRVHLSIRPPPFTIGYYLGHKWGKKFLVKYIERFKPDIVYLPKNTSYESIEDILEVFRGELAIHKEDIGDQLLLEKSTMIYGVEPEEIKEYLEKTDKLIHVHVSDPGKDFAGLSAKHRSRLIVDLTITYDNLLEKLQRYKNIEALKAAWVSNIAYSVDVDSHGLYFMLMKLLGEAGVGIIIVSEFEDKLLWSLQEISVINKMLTLSSYLGAEPSGIGVDLLYVKDKTIYTVEFPAPDKTVEARRDQQYRIDPMGIFKIRINHTEGIIEALYIGRKGKILIRGRDCESIRDTILDLGLISSMSHAFYLGGEICKAYEALRIGKNYEQEKNLLPSRINYEILGS